MPNAENTQGGGAKAPPIPTMDVSPPPPATAREIGAQVAKIARDARAGAQDARTQARAASQGGPNPGQVATTAPPSFNPPDVIPQQAVDISIGLFVTVAACVIGFPIARALGRRIDTKSQAKAVAGPDVTPQLRQLQDSVDAMAIELERISEGQRFTTKLLAERSGSAAEQ